MTRGGVAALAVALAAVASPAPAAAPSTYRVGKVGAELTYEVYRISPAPRHLEIQFDVDPVPHELSTIQSVALVRRGSGWTWPNGWHDGFTGYHEFGNGEAWPAVYGLPAAVPPCPNPAACTSLLEGPVRLTARSAYPDLLTYYFQLTDATAVATIKTPGWRLRPTTKVRFRRVLAEQVSTGVQVGLSSVERFTGATLPGGRYGSRARVYLPCMDAGHGKAYLSGGIDQPAYSRTRPYCSTDPNETFGQDYAFRQTTWRVTGDVIGSGAYHARLVVVDFPKP
jgi:hypothetical protein